MLASVLPDDAANVFITLTARELNPDIEIIARSQSPSTEKKLPRSGATRVVLPAAIGASRIARMITSPSAQELLSNAGGHEAFNDDLSQIGLRISEFQFDGNSTFISRQLGTISFGWDHQFVLIAIRADDKSVIRNPAADNIIQPGDTMIVLAHRDAAPQLRQNFATHEMVYRGVRR